MKVVIALLVMALSGIVFGERVEVDKTVADLGVFSIHDGEQSCEFSVRNVSRDSVTILAVVSSCGCTKVEWTRTPLPPEETGSIKVVFANSEGASEFDKTLAVYISDCRKPLILHVKGKAVKKKKN